MHTSIHSEFTGNTRHSPRNGLRLITRSPRGPGFLAPVIDGIASTNLMPASGHQDHTPSPSASRAIRQRRIRVHRIPHSTFVTIASAPPIEAGRRDYRCDLGLRRSELFFREGLDKRP